MKWFNIKEALPQPNTRIVFVVRCDDEFRVFSGTYGPGDYNKIGPAAKEAVFRCDKMRQDDVAQNFSESSTIGWLPLYALNCHKIQKEIK